ncbi:glycosylphosphatidylinositol anchor biosynthesis [Tulasnella sp. UAMH 9824]|nr:glycosylphosphatidylinositol anchor biosynthesis [Tulasnella sp. UAMH 9824]
MGLPKPILRLLLVASVLSAYFAYDFYSEYQASQNDYATKASVESFFSARKHANQGHTNNWAVLVCSSRYWFNYRHMANALGMYRTVKRLGIPDSNIILMLADDAACNSRNKFAGSVYANKGRGLDLYGDNIEVDYRGYEVTVENFIRVLTGRVADSMPRSKRLLSDDRSNIFIYMTGHGGNEFLKFQDNEEISAFDLADAIEQMWQKKRYNEIFFMIDTCQANTMYSKLYSPNILATGSSKLAESSYSHENDNDIGVAVIDSYTHHVLSYLENVNKTSKATMQDLFSTYSFEKIRSHAGVRSDLFNRPLDQTLITDFFGGVAQVEVLYEQDAEQQSSGESIEEVPAPSLPTRPPAVLASERPQRMPGFKAQPVSDRQSTNSTLNTVKAAMKREDSGLLHALKLWGSSLLVGLLLVWTLSR